MSNIVLLKKITLINFKGAKHLSIDFDKVTSIFGDNATYKTTVFDAFTWLFFGKDSTDRKDFNIKTLDGSGHAIPKLEHEVSAIVSINGQDTELRRVFKEKWVKQRGASETEFIGHETFYYYNDVPLQAAEFKAKVDAIMNENIFKLITNPLYFNSMKWQERREVLMQIAGIIEDAEIFSKITTDKNRSQIDLLNNTLKAGKSLIEYKRELVMRKKKIKEDLTSIPTRIDEINRNMPEPVDFGFIQVSIDEKSEAIRDIENDITNRSNAYNKQFEASQLRQSNIHKLKTDLSTIEYGVKTDLNKSDSEKQLKKSRLQQNVSVINSDIRTKTNLINSKKNSLTDIETKIQKLREQWGIENAKELHFDEHEFNCPTCQRLFEKDDIDGKKEILTDNFNHNKQTVLNRITNEGKSLSDNAQQTERLIHELEDAVMDLTSDVSKLQNELNELELENNGVVPESQKLDTALLANTEYQSILSQLNALAIVADQPAELDLSDLKDQKATLAREIDELKSKLNNKEVIERANARIAELEKEERVLAQQIADLEQTEFTIDEFSRAKIDMIESRINGKFNYVTFKLFDTQINGGEVECCEALVNGVPFSDANTASKINAGLDIINTLCTHYQVYAPIFIDNRESVNQLIACESQIVNLIVSKDQTLRVAS